MKKKKTKKGKISKFRIPKSTRSCQVHKSLKDYDRKDDKWKIDESPES